MGQRAERNDSVRHDQYAQLHKLAELLRPLGPFDLRLMGQLSRIWKLLAPIQRRFRLDTLHERELDTRSTTRLDLGEQRTLGLDAVSLRNLAAFSHSGRGLDPGRALRTTPMAARVRLLGTHRQSDRLGGEEPERPSGRASEPGA